MMNNCKLNCIMVLNRGTWKEGLNAEQIRQIQNLLSPLFIIKALLLAIVGTIGVIFIIKNIQEWSTAYQQADSTTMNQAIKGIVSGFLMAGVAVLIGLFGF